MANNELTVSRDNVLALSRAVGDAPWYAARRLAAWDVYRATPMPGPTDEPWRRTPLTGFKWGMAALPPFAAAGTAHRAPAALTRPIAGNQQAGQILLAGGKAEIYCLDAPLQDQKVVFTDFLTAARDYPDQVEKYVGSTLAAREGKFAALAETLANGGLFVHVPAGVQVALPLHFSAWLTQPAQFNRVLIGLDEGASATVVLDWASPKSPAAALHAVVAEAFVGPNAHLTLVEHQALARNVWHFATERVHVDRDARVDWILSAVGSRLTKNFAVVDLEGQGAAAKMSGFYFGDENQHFDYDTQQNHLVPHTTSDLLFKGVVKDKSRSVWQGMIYVAPGAQKTDGYQANRNLVLSETAHADSLPGLEILNDDVRCTHGATVGQVDQEHIFYLMSRGLPRAEAERLTVGGFFEPVLERIPSEGVRQRLRRAIQEKMS